MRKGLIKFLIVAIIILLGAGIYFGTCVHFEKIGLKFIDTKENYKNNQFYLECEIESIQDETMQVKVIDYYRNKSLSAYTKNEDKVTDSYENEVYRIVYNSCIKNKNPSKKTEVIFNSFKDITIKTWYYDGNYKEMLDYEERFSLDENVLVKYVDKKINVGDTIFFDISNNGIEKIEEVILTSNGDNNNEKYDLFDTSGASLKIRYGYYVPLKWQSDISDLFEKIEIPRN